MLGRRPPVVINGTDRKAELSPPLLSLELFDEACRAERLGALVAKRQNTIFYFEKVVRLDSQIPPGSKEITHPSRDPGGPPPEYRLSRGWSVPRPGGR